MDTANLQQVVILACHVVARFYFYQKLLMLFFIKCDPNCFPKKYRCRAMPAKERIKKEVRACMERKEVYSFYMIFRI
jgi:hypothetical protein